MLRIAGDKLLSSRVTTAKYAVWCARSIYRLAATPFCGSKAMPSAYVEPKVDSRYAESSMLFVYDQIWSQAAARTGKGKNAIQRRWRRRGTRTVLALRVRQIKSETPQHSSIACVSIVAINTAKCLCRAPIQCALYTSVWRKVLQKHFVIVGRAVVSAGSCKMPLLFVLFSFSAAASERLWLRSTHVMPKCYTCA